jgi:hypothetical protein
MPLFLAPHRIRNRFLYYLWRPAYVSIRQHTSAYVSIRQPSLLHIASPTAFFTTCKDVSIRQHTSAYVSIRQRCPSSLLHTASATAFFTTCGDQHTSAYVSIRQHTSLLHIASATAFLLPVKTSAYASIRQHTSAYVSIRQHTSASAFFTTCGDQHTSAYVSIRQHTSAYVSIRQQPLSLLPVATPWGANSNSRPASCSRGRPPATAGVSICTFFTTCGEFEFSRRFVFSGAPTCNRWRQYY